ncbi:MAG: ShlB/FhaC/HecB family hemolysin secretion/activation protein [Gammaproteobacteria bacterium]
MFHKHRESRLLVITVLVLAIAANARAADPTPLSAAVIRGSTIYTPADLFAAYRSELGRPIDRACAQAVIAAVDAMYTRDGYSRPEIRANDELLARGILQLEVFEPQITQVTIGGDAGPYRQTLERLSAQLRDMQPVRPGEIQRVLARMRELPGLSVSAATRRDETRRDETRRNGHVVAVETSFDPVDGVVRASNRGTEEIGPAFIVGQTVANGLLSHGEKLGLLFTAATDVDEYRGGGVFVDAPITTHGTRAFLMTFASSSEPSVEPNEPIDRYARGRVTLRVTQPVPSATRFDVSLAAALDAEDFEIRRDGAKLREERLRVVQLGARASWRSGARTQYLATLDVRQGLTSLGGGLQAADLVDDIRREDFLLTRLQLVGVTRFNEAWSVRVDALAQHTGYVLPYSERFKIGGERLGRGFEVTEIAGDRGAGAKVEVRRVFATPSTFFGKPSVYGFYDIGATWTQDAGGRASAATGGIGFAAQLGRVTGYVEVAKPLTRPDVEGKKSATVFAEISLPF